MPTDWDTRTIADVADIYDGPHATPTKTAAGPWFLSISSLANGRLVLDESAHLDEDDFVRWTRRVTPQEGDVLFSYETRLGEAALMPANLRACLGRRMGLLRPKGINPRFLVYSYLGPAFQSEIAARTIRGATVERLSLGDLGNWPIAVPEEPVQDAIARVLGALDDKIELNRRMNGTLEALSRATWMAAQGAHPCESMPVSSLADYVNGGAYTKGADGRGRPVIRIRELNGGVSQATPRSSIQPQADQVANDGDLLFSWSGSLDVYRWHGEQAIVNQHIFKVIPKSIYPQWLVHHALRDVMPTFQGIARDKATTMGHIQRGHLDQTVVHIPRRGIARLDARIAPMYALMGANFRESATLTELRDTLLPELISGRLPIKDAESKVEAAV